MWRTQCSNYGYNKLLSIFWLTYYKLIFLASVVNVGSGLSVSGSGRVGFKTVGFLSGRVKIFTVGSGRVEFPTKLQPSTSELQRGLCLPFLIKRY